MKNPFEQISNLFERPEVLDPANFNVDLGQFPLAQVESRVFKGEENGKECVYKVYDIPLTKGQIVYDDLKKYQQVTESVGQKIKNSRILFNSEDGGELDFKLDIVPIRKIGILPYGKIACSVSDYIDGLNLKDLINQNESLECEPGINNKPFYSDVFTKKNEKNVLESLKDLSGKLNVEMGTSGIELGLINVKPAVVAGERVLFVTDLYNELTSIKNDAVLGK